MNPDAGIKVSCLTVLHALTVAVKYKKCRFYQTTGRLEADLHKGTQNRHLNGHAVGGTYSLVSNSVYVDGFHCTLACHNHQCSFTEQSFPSSSPSFPSSSPPSFCPLRSSAPLVSSGLSGILWDLSANELTPTISHCSYSNIPGTLGTFRSNAVALQGHFQPLSKKISK